MQLPLKVGGVEHQHFNLGPPDKPAIWIAIICMPIHEYLASDMAQIEKAVELLASAKRPIIYAGGGIINSGPKASTLLRELVEMTGFPITSTLMGLGAYPASGDKWLGMLGMHGTLEANLAMHHADLVICVGARFDDRVTGRLDGFAPRAQVIHIDIDAAEMGKPRLPDVAGVADVKTALEQLVAQGGAGPQPFRHPAHTTS